MLVKFWQILFDYLMPHQIKICLFQLVLMHTITFIFHNVFQMNETMIN